MDRERQSGMMDRAVAARERIMETTEARRKRELVDALESAQLMSNNCTEWFDTSVEKGKKLATRIFRNTDDEEPGDNERIYVVQVGITTEGGKLDGSDPDYTIFDHARIEFEDSAEGRREVTITLAGDLNAKPLDYIVLAWDEVHYTVLGAPQRTGGGGATA